jgi:YVTN family beta-propeller protein
MKARTPGISPRARLLAVLAALSVTTTLTAAAAAAEGPVAEVASAPPAKSGLTDVLLVGNNWEGTVDVIHPQTFQLLDRINVAPDFQAVVSSMTPDERQARELNNRFAAEGHDQLVDDMRVSPDGRVLYVSRPSLQDAIALDLETREILWRTKVSMYRPDHMALSPDGTELLVSATVANVVEVIDTRTGAIIDQIPTGDFPHENEYSHDGELIFNGAIGRVITPDFELLDIAKGNRWITIADADTHEVIKVIEFDRGVRPFVVMEDNRTAYIQLSFLHGFVEYDLQEERVLRTVDLPLSEEAQQLEREDYPLDSAHHGLAINDDGTKICDAGTVSNYVAIVSRPSLTVDDIIPVGRKPYWATSSTDGEYCFVANSDTDDVSVISYDRATEVARIPVGGDRPHPQRMRMAAVDIPGLPLPHLRLSMKPRHPEAGETTRLRFRVGMKSGAPLRGGAGRRLLPLEGATVRFRKERVRTGPRGRASLTVEFQRSGRVKAFARAPGFARDRAKARVREGG